VESEHTAGHSGVVHHALDGPVVLQSRAVPEDALPKNQRLRVKCDPKRWTRLWFKRENRWLRIWFEEDGTLRGGFRRVIDLPGNEPGRCGVVVNGYDDETIAGLRKQLGALDIELEDPANA